MTSIEHVLKEFSHWVSQPLFHVGDVEVSLSRITLALLIVALIWTAPNRWGAGIALHYLSRVYWPDPSDPLPPGL